MGSKKNFVLHLLISEIKAGNNPAEICKKHNIKKQNLQYYLRQLRDEGIVERVGYGVWKVVKEVKKTTKAHRTQKQIRGHAFNWKVRFKHEINWVERLEKFKIKYQLIGINSSTPRIIFQDKKIWFTKTGLVIYEPKSFFSQSSHTSKGMAVFELDSTVKALGRKLGISLDFYEFSTSREHYGQIKNELARQYNEKGEKLFIRDDGGIWMWIDDSHSLSELETNKPITSKNVQDWYNDMKKTKFEVTPSFLLESLDKIVKNFEHTQTELEGLKQENQLIKNQLSLNKSIRDVNPPSYIM